MLRSRAGFGFKSFTFRAVLGGLIVSAWAQAAHSPPQFETTYSDSDLKTVVYLRPTRDGRFLYTSQYGAGVPGLLIFSIDSAGDLKKVGSLASQPFCKGLLDIQLSPDDSRLAAACTGSSSVALFARDAISGALVPLSYVQEGIDVESGLAGVKRLEFTKDGKWILAAGTNGLTLLSIDENGVMTVAAAATSPTLTNTRGIALSPDDRYVYLTQATSGTLMVAKVERSTDGATGGLTWIQQLTDGALDAGGTPIPGLANIFGADVDQYGNLYTTTGRFNGVSYLSVWKPNSDGTLSLREQLNFGPGSDLPNLDGIHYLAFEDGQQAFYVTFFKSDKVLRIAIGADQKLKVTDVLSQQVATPSGICVDPAGKWLYVGVEISGAITRYRLGTP